MACGSALLGVVLLPGCSDLGEPLRPARPPAPPAVTVSFAADIQPILTSNCIGCHGSVAPTANLDLSAGASRANLVNVVSSGYAPALRVAPADTSASVLFHKVFGTGSYGAQMPFGGSLPQVERERIRAWILEGARDN